METLDRYMQYGEMIKAGMVEGFKNVYDMDGYNYSRQSLSHPLALRSRNGQSLLHVAAEFGALEIVLFLLDEGAKINERSEWGETPLHRAVMFGKVDVVDALLARFADPRIKDRQHNNPLYYAYQAENEHMMRQLWRQGARFNDWTSHDISPLHRGSSLKMLQFLLTLGVDANRPNCKGQRPYEFAVNFKWRVDHCRLLMKYTHPLPPLSYFHISDRDHRAAILELNQLHTRILILSSLGKNSEFSFCHDILRSIAEFA
jgi:ankyrin repeat protein